MNITELLSQAQNGIHSACTGCPWNPKLYRSNKPAFGVSCTKHGIDWHLSGTATSMLIAQDPAGTTPEKTGNLCGYCNAAFSTDHSAQQGLELWKAAVSLADSGPGITRYMKGHYWTNAIMHGIKNDGNRELARRYCSHFLIEQINALTPRVIIVVGKAAFNSVYDLGLISRHWDDFKNEFPRKAYSEEIKLPNQNSSTIFCTFHGSATAVNTHVAHLYSTDTSRAILDRVEQLPNPFPARNFLRQHQGDNENDKGMKVLLLHWLDIGRAIRQANEG